MSKSRSESGGGIGFCGLLTILFIGLKLTGYINWSWWWVLSPLWLPLGVFMAVMCIVSAVMLVMAFVAWLFDH